MIITAVIGLSGALIYGGADFLGGLAAKRLRSILVTAIAAATGLVLFLLVAPLFGGAWTAGALGWGALSGVFGALAVVLLYACLAIGPMSILSPLTAVVSAIAPLIWGLLVEGEQLSGLAYLGLGVALVAVVLVGFVPGEGIVRPRTRGIVMAIGAGVAIGGFLIVLDQPASDSGIVPLIASRAASLLLVSLAIAVLAVLARLHPGVDGPFAFPTHGIPAGGTPTGHVDVADARRPVVSGDAVGSGIALAVVCGVLDAVANAFLLFGLRLGDLAVMSVLTAMYPAGTILLAAVVLRERIAAVQWVGLALALAAGGLFALA
ncbi:MAG TPA: EamA/RhaT family transporter [Microbacterium sp.]|uniref:EamA family transporter n=1 Tax=Microbacterium sp. TaxID=51671 RepID=UPI002BDDFC19|nr:EamA/RhaT family transporter [Microbacterium sp.]HWI32022.1 EamA/RhaT family transporter [Microbacterium sp.]